MNTRYDVALSFAGEDREYVDQDTRHLRRKGVELFYDKYEQVDLWGKDLYEHLSDVYQNRARFTVMFVSRNYAEKLWPRHERRNAQARAFRESEEYILPVRFDDTEVPGLPETVSYLDLRHRSPEQLAEAICEKLIKSGVALTSEPTWPAGEDVPAKSPSRVTVAVKSEEGKPVLEADLLLVASNGTYLQARTDQEGHASFDVVKRRMLTVFCAHANYPAYHGPDYDPVRDLNITLPKIQGVGSLISTGGWSQIPGLTGVISPIHDSLNRLYIYTKNIAVQDGQPQPVPFEIGQPLHVEDVDGRERFLTFVSVVGDVFLIEYLTP